jgi:hypothetical protein
MTQMITASGKPSPAQDIHWPIAPKTNTAASPEQEKQATTSGTPKTCCQSGDFDDRLM